MNRGHNTAIIRNACFSALREFFAGMDSPEANLAKALDLGQQIAEAADYLAETEPDRDWDGFISACEEVNVLIAKWDQFVKGLSDG